MPHANQTPATPRNRAQHACGTAIPRYNRRMNRALLLAPLLAACAASPSPMMWGAQHQDVVVAGRGYTVYWSDNEFEVVRHGYASAGEHQAIRATMLTLVPQVTHCPIGRGEGDSGEMHGTLTC